MVEDCPSSAEPGYVRDYVPELSETFTTQYDTDFLDGDDREYINTTTTVDCASYYNGEQKRWYLSTCAACCVV